MLAKVRYTVGTIADFPDESCRIAALGEGECLIVRHKNKFHAVGSVCPHQNAPMNDGSLESGQIICRRHGYRFDLKTGDCRTIGGYGIPVYPVTLEGDSIVVTVYEEQSPTL